MRTAIIDNFVVVEYTACFSCQQVLICRLIFFNCDETRVDKIEWALLILTRAPSWKWMRTGNRTCRRVCMDCLGKKRQVSKSLLVGGYGVPRPWMMQMFRPKTLPDLIECIDLGLLERA